MFFNVLVPVQVTEQDPNPELDAKIKEQIAQMHDQLVITVESYKNFRLKAEIAKLVGRSTPFARAVFDAVDKTMDPYNIRSENPARPEFVDQTSFIRDQYLHGTAPRIRMPDGMIVTPYEVRDKYEVKDGKVYHKDPKTAQLGPEAENLTFFPELPLREVYTSEAEVAEKFLGRKFYPEHGVYGYCRNAAGFHDGCCVGGLWPEAFVVPESCLEYSLGSSYIPEGGNKFADGFILVAAARKKDIAWQIARERSLEYIKGAYSDVKDVWASKDMPCDWELRFTDNGLAAQNGDTVYVAGESFDTFRAREYKAAESKYQLFFRGYLAPDGYHERPFFKTSINTVEEAEEQAAIKTKWLREIDSFIDGLDDDTVLVCVDCHR